LRAREPGPMGGGSRAGLWLAAILNRRRGNRATAKFATSNATSSRFAVIGRDLIAVANATAKVTLNRSCDTAFRRRTSKVEQESEWYRRATTLRAAELWKEALPKSLTRPLDSRGIAFRDRAVLNAYLSSMRPDSRADGLQASCGLLLTAPPPHREQLLFPLSAGRHSFSVEHTYRRRNFSQSATDVTRIPYSALYTTNNVPAPCHNQRTGTLFFSHPHCFCLVFNFTPARRTFTLRVTNWCLRSAFVALQTLFWAYF